jgi:hypothetical protein
MIGDSHNFGQRVELRNDGWVVKPRSIFWERLFLSSASPLRQKIHEIFKVIGIAPNVLPYLEFQSDDLSCGGLVEFCHVKDLSPADHLDDSHWHSIGSVCALMAWFGISDLHKSNMVCGWDGNGEFNFAPIDIESAVDDFELLSQTLLLPTKDISESICGLSAVLTYYKQRGGNIAALCEGYDRMFQALEERRDLLLNCLTQVTSHQHRVASRLIFRATRDYVAYLDGRLTEKDFIPSLHAEELKQLSRGDVPFFFRYLNSKDVQAYAAPGVIETVTLDDALTESVLRYAVVLSEKRLVFKNRSTLRKAGLLQLARCFDPQQVTSYSTPKTNLVYELNLITVSFADRQSIAVKRRA